MSSLFRFGRPIAFIGFVVTLAACQGSVGQTPPVTTSGIQAPVVQSAQQAGTEANAEISAHADVTYAPDLKSLAFPSAEGYALTVALGTPAPLASGVSSEAAISTPTPRSTSTPNALLSPEPSATPTVEARGRHRHEAQEKDADLIRLGMAARPAGAPDAPTPGASAIPMRVAVMRASLFSPHELWIASLDALHFTVPEGAGRAFSVAVFEEQHHRRHKLIASDTEVRVDAKGVAATSGSMEPIAFKAGQGYRIYLYADPAAVPTAPAPGFSSGGSSSPNPSGVGGSPAPVSAFPRFPRGGL